MYGGPGSGGGLALFNISSDILKEPKCKMLNESHQHLQPKEYSIAGGGQPDYPAALSSLQHMDSEQLKVTQF